MPENVRPGRGAWIEIETDVDGVMYVRIDRKRKFPVTNLLTIFGGGVGEGRGSLVCVDCGTGWGFP